MERNEYQPVARSQYYRMLIDSIIDQDALREGILTDRLDIRMARFVDRVWHDDYLRRWLCSPNKACAPVSEVNFVRLLGWMQSHDFFADGVTKLRLAAYLEENMPIAHDWSRKTILKYLCEGVSKLIDQRLKA